MIVGWGKCRSEGTPLQGENQYTVESFRVYRERESVTHSLTLPTHSLTHSLLISLRASCRCWLSEISGQERHRSSSGMYTASSQTTTRYVIPPICGCWLSDPCVACHTTWECARTRAHFLSLDILTASMCPIPLVVLVLFPPVKATIGVDFALKGEPPHCDILLVAGGAAFLTAWPLRLLQSPFRPIKFTNSHLFV